MQVAIDKQTNALATWRGSGLTKMRAKRYGQFSFYVRFMEDGRVVDLGTGADGMVVIKLSMQDATSLAASSTWQKRGSGPGTYYILKISLNTNPVNSWFAENAGKNLITGIIEFRYTFGDTDDRSATATFEIENAAISGDVPPAVDGQPAWPMPGNIMRISENGADVADPAQFRKNIGLERMLFRNPVAGPVSFEDEGEEGDYWYDDELSVLWAYIGARWVNTTFFNQQ